MWEEFDLAEITETVLTTRRHEADTNSIQIRASLPTAPLTGDPKLVESLVANLIDNAIRHNIRGGNIDISTSSASGRAALTLTNTGPTVPAGKIDGLFQPFQQVGSPRTGHRGGHGLGLAIVSAIAKAHHATIAAHPCPQGGLGVTVTFSSFGSDASHP